MKNIPPLIFVSALFATFYGLGWLPDETPFINMLAKGSGVTLLATYAAYKRRFVLAAALAFGALGDVFLAAPLANSFMFGLSAFLIGHLFYIKILCPTRTSVASHARKIIAAVVIILSALMAWHLVPQLGEKLIPVVLYMAVLGGMTLLAQFSRTPFMVAVGAFLFFLSDVILGLNLFSHSIEVPRWVNWWVYYPAQLLLCLGLMNTGARHED